MRSLSNRLFVPDNKVLWIPFARRAAERIIGSQQIDLIFSTAPPFSSHVLATALGKKHGIPVVTDYRDNWVGNPRAVYASKRQKERHARLEYSALIGSDHVVTINDYIVKDMVARSKISPKTISVIEQGYDPDDYPDRFRIAPTDDSVTFVHSGIFYDAQKPDTFLQGLALARDRSKLVREKAKAVFIGLVPDNFSEMLQELGLLSVVSHTGYLDHREALARLMSSQVPWLTIGHQVGSEQISTGKLAEYVGSEKPILGLVPNGAAKDMLDAYGDGHVAPPDDVAEVARLIVLLTERFQNGTDNVQDQIAPTADKVNHSYVRKLNRKVLTKELASIFDRCANAG